MASARRRGPCLTEEKSSNSWASVTSFSRSPTYSDEFASGVLAGWVVAAGAEDSVVAMLDFKTRS